MNLDLKKIRLNHQLSQVKLAHESGVSLPTIQNIEAGKANPTIEVIEKLLHVFGLQYQVLTPEFDPERAAAFGVPLLSHDSHHQMLVNKNTLKIEARKWLHSLMEQKLSERDKLAVIAFLKAIKDHYPSFYEHEISTSFYDQLIQQHVKDGRVIKLRRIALSNVSQYL